MDETKLMDELARLIETGTEEDVRTFIIGHLPEFPEEVRASFMLDILNEALDTEVDGLKRIIDLKEKVAKLIAFSNNETTEM